MAEDHPPQLSDRVHPTTAEKLSKLPFGIGFDAANSVFTYLTFFGSVFVLYLNTLGFNKSQIGFVLSLLPFLIVLSLFAGPVIDRLGSKRTFLNFWGARTLISIGLLFVPWVLRSYGAQAALVLIVLVTTSFSAVKSIGLVSLMPWKKEFVPDSIRGKYSAFSQIASSGAGLLAMVLSGFVLNYTLGLGGYTFLFAVGILFAILSLILASRVPGGKASELGNRSKRRFRDYIYPFTDYNFALFLGGSALITLATGPLNSFSALYMEEDIGLSSGDVALLGIGTLLGGILTGYFWGWASDRYGSRPVMISGLLFLVLYPLLLIIVPSNSVLNMPTAFMVFLYGGFATIGWTIGSLRQLYSSLIPSEHDADYSVVYQSWVGVFGGLSALASGRILDLYAGSQLILFSLELDAYTILFLAVVVLLLAAVILVRLIRLDSRLSVGEFAGLFYHGNPIMAMESMIRFNLAFEETATISVTERLGQSHSPLTVEELLLALDDPRFLVRFEALVSIGRHGTDDRLREALVEVLNGDDPAMSVIAAWSLGRMRDPLAIDPLRSALNSRYRSVRAHAARSLAGLEDLGAVPTLRRNLETEIDKGLNLVYATSLAKLDDIQVIPRILKLIQMETSEIGRKELALALARLIGSEGDYIRLLRQVRQDRGTAYSQSLSSLAKKFELLDLDGEIVALANQSSEAFARQDLDEGILYLASMACKLPDKSIEEPFRELLDLCIQQAKLLRGEANEYSLLILHLLHNVF